MINLFKEHHNLDLVYGDHAILYSDGRLVAKPKISYNFDICLNAYLTIPQPSSFWSKKIYRQLDGFNEAYQYCFDYDFYLRLGHIVKNEKERILHIEDLWSMFRLHENSKTVSSKSDFSRETKLIRKQFKFCDNKCFRPFIKRYYLSKALVQFYKERKIIPLSSG